MGLREEVDALILAAIDSWNTERNNLNSVITDLRSRLTNTEALLTAVAEDLTSTQLDLARAEENLVNKNNQILQLETQVAELNAEIARLRILLNTYLPKTLFGAYLQDGVNPFGTLNAHRVFDGGAPATYLGSAAAKALTSAKTVVYSHKPGLTTSEATLEAFYKTFPKSRHFSLIVQHEPENNNYSTTQIQQWKDLQTRHKVVVDRLRNQGWQMDAYICLMGWTGDPTNANRTTSLAKWWVPDIGIAWDPYVHADKQGDNMAALRDYCKSKNVPWAVAEYGVDIETIATDSAGLTRIKADTAVMQDTNYPAKFGCYFHANGTWGNGPRAYRFDTTNRTQCLNEWKRLSSL